MQNMQSDFLLLTASIEPLQFSKKKHSSFDQFVYRESALAKNTHLVVQVPRTCS